MPGYGGADVVRASALARSGDLRLRLAVSQGKNLIIEARRIRSAASSFAVALRGRDACSRWRSCFPAAFGVLAEAVLLTPEFVDTNSTSMEFESSERRGEPSARSASTCPRASLTRCFSLAIYHVPRWLPFGR